MPGMRWSDRITSTSCRAISCSACSALVALSTSQPSRAQQPAQRGDDVLLVVDQQQGALPRTPAEQRRIDLPAVAQHRLDRCRRQCGAEPVALHLVALVGGQQRRLAFAFDAFGEHLHLQLVRHRDDGARDRHVFRRRGDVGHQRAVDLDHVHRQPAQVAQARVAGAEVVERDLDAERTQRPQVLHRLIEVGDQHALGDLDAEQPRVEAGRGEQAFDAPRQVRLQQLARRQVDRHAQRRQPGTLPGRGLLDGAAQHPVADGDDQAGLFGDRDESIRRDAAQRRVLPAQQGLDADDAAMHAGRPAAGSAVRAARRAAHGAARSPAPAVRGRRRAARRHRR